MHGERRCLRERFAAHGAKIRPLARVDALMHHVIFAMREALAAHIANQRPGPVHRLVRRQQLGGSELLGARVARIDGHGGLGRHTDTAEITGGNGIDDGRHRVRGSDTRYNFVAVVVPGRRDRLMSFRVVIVQIPRLETHQASGAGVRLLLAGLVHPTMTLEQRAIPETRLAEIAGERFLRVTAPARRHETRRGRRARGHGRGGMRDLVHLQVA